MENDVTYLGKIIRVDSNTIEVEVSDTIPSSSPIIEGKIYKIGQIGTFVKIPVGNIISYGIVDSVSNTPSNIVEIEKINNFGNRYLTINLIGEKIGDGRFEKGIGLYPTINDEVHIVTESDLKDIYGGADKGLISIGKHASSDNLDIYLDLHKLVLRHSAILGSTGSGKSNSTVGILKRIISEFPNSRVVLIDPHGEYGSAFPSAKVYKINDKNNPLANTKDDQTDKTVCETSKGNPELLQRAEFKPYAMGNKEPYKSQHQEFYSYEKKLLNRLKDSRYDFLFHSVDYEDEKSPKDLHDLLQGWIGNTERLTILDLSNVPFEVMDITVGLITRFIYDSMFWGRYEPYTGKNRPLLLAYEEAHTYLGKDDSTRYAKTAVERIFKEGRKFGIGAMVISQRPSEISETILAQIGTFIALRLTNSTDQSIVKSMAPDNMNSLINLLPSLRIGEAVVVGEAIRIPSRIRLPIQNPRPDSADPKLFECWNKELEINDENYKAVVTKIREQRL